MFVMVDPGANRRVGRHVKEGDRNLLYKDEKSEVQWHHLARGKKSHEDQEMNPRIDRRQLLNARSMLECLRGGVIVGTRQWFP